MTGPEAGPNDLRGSGLHNEIKENTHWRLLDHGDVEWTTRGKGDTSSDEVPGARNCVAVGRACESIHDSLLPVAAQDHFILTVGGDHSIPMGTIPAIIKHRPGTKIIWVDAHADINTPDTSSSGNLHGQPLGLLVHGVYKPGVSTLPGFEWLSPCLNPEDIVYIGLRDVDRYEKMAIKDFGIKTYTMFDIDRLGIGQVMDEVLDYVGDSNMHLSFDIDACDPFFAPSTGTKVGGGLTLREANFVCESLADTQRLTSMDMVEINTTLTTCATDETVEVAKGLVSAALGSSRDAHTARWAS
jgi:arginase